MLYNTVMAEISLRKVDKHEAAVVQLKVGIRMFFERKDPLAVHALAYNSQSILRDLGKKFGIRSSLLDALYIIDDFKEQYIKTVRGVANFFKHADRDPDAILEYNEDTAALVLFDAVILHWNFTKKPPDIPELQVLLVWMSLKYPDIVKEGAMKDIVNQISYITNADDYDCMLRAIDESYEMCRIKTSGG